MFPLFDRRTLKSENEKLYQLYTIAITTCWRLRCIQKYLFRSEIHTLYSQEYRWINDLL